jgi:hypothetical protein
MTYELFDPRALKEWSKLGGFTTNQVQDKRQSAVYHAQTNGFSRK